MEPPSPPPPPKGNTQTKLKLDGGCKTRNNQGFFVRGSRTVHKNKCVKAASGSSSVWNVLDGWVTKAEVMCQHVFFNEMLVRFQKPTLGFTFKEGRGHFKGKLLIPVCPVCFLQSG